MLGLFEALLKAFSELTLRRFMSLLMIAFICMLGFMGYERFTSSFSLNRIQRSAELLKELADLRKSGLDDELKGVCDRLVGQLQKAVEADPLSLRVVSKPFVFKTEVALKFLFSGAIWFGISLFSIRKALRREQDGVNSFFGLLGAGCIFGILGIFIPAIWWPYFHLVIFPFLIAVLLMISGLFLASRNANKSTQ